MDESAIAQLDDWRRHALACQRWCEHQLVDVVGNGAAREDLLLARRNAIGVQRALLRVIDRATPAPPATSRE